MLNTFQAGDTLCSYFHLSDSITLTGFQLAVAVCVIVGAHERTERFIRESGGIDGDGHVS